MGINNNDRDDVFVKGDDGTVDGKRVEAETIQGVDRLRVDSTVTG